ncbi:MAG: PHP domain-containing protein, partial [Clostridia bacterium]
MSNRRVSDKLAEANVSPGDVASSLLERARFDLHLHTTASDGTDTPETVVALAKQAGCAVIAITDHDTMEGLTAGICAAQVERLTLIPGMEVSAGGEAEIHLLAYGVSAADTRLQAVLDAWRQERRARVERMLEKCRMQGLKLEMEDFPAKCSIGRAHVAAAMVRAGAVKDLRQAFDRYLGVGKPCYVPRNTVSATKVITWLRDCGAVPVLAHPGQLRIGDQALTSCLPDWCAAGLL